MLPDSLLEQPYECYIAPNISGPFFPSARVGEIEGFGRYLKFVITPSDQLLFAAVEGRGRPQDAFCMRMDAQLVLRVPEKVADK